MTVRLNITIPDELSERLERVRDRINASKVCAQALEREIDMIETKPAVADPAVQRAIQRLQTTADKWRVRGAKDGREWALNAATREELIAATHRLDDPNDFTFPDSYSSYSRIRGWVSSDVEADLALWDIDNPEHTNADAKTVAQRKGSRARAEMELRQKIDVSVDNDAYAKGWDSAVREVWELIKSSLTV